MKYAIRAFMIVLAALCALCVLISCEELMTELSPPKTQTEQGDWDFYRMSEGTHGIKATSSFAQTNADIPAEHNGVTVTHIMSGAFMKKTMLQSVTLPGTIMYIGSTAFAECTALETIEIPEGVTEIDMLAFANCTSLTEVKLPASLKRLGDSLFDGCTALRRVQYAGTMAQWQALEQRCPNWNQYTKHLIVVCSDGAFGADLVYYLPYDGRHVSIALNEDGKCTVKASVEGEEDYRCNYWIQDDKLYMDIETGSKVHVFSMLENALVLDCELTTANLWHTMASMGPVVYFLPGVTIEEQLGTIAMAEKGWQQIPQVNICATYEVPAVYSDDTYTTYAFTAQYAPDVPWSETVLGTDYTLAYTETSEIMIYSFGKLMTVNEAMDRGYLPSDILENLHRDYHDCSIAHSYDQGVIGAGAIGEEEILYTCIVCHDTKTVPLPDTFAFRLTYRFDLTYDSETGELTNGYNYDQDTKCETTLLLDHHDLMNIYRIFYNGNAFEIQEDFFATEMWAQPSYQIKFSYTADGDTTSFVISNASHVTYSEWQVHAAFCYAYEEVVQKYICGSDAFASMPPNQNVYY